uniref:Putative low density lipoprotein receptor adaptor protein 1 n=1 Tax=Nyssomyia neivai TaxID=330878 RepID=A0A1L8DN84_9DIPT
MSNSSKTSKSSTPRESKESKDELEVKVEDLPMVFKVKYLGKQKGNGLWGIKHTRKPVDKMVAAAKEMSPGKVLPICNLTVTLDAIVIETIPNKITEYRKWVHNVDTISYGVQDIVYSRVFSIILVNEESVRSPFEVEAFVCDSRAMARKLTFALAAAFQDYSRRLQDQESEDKDSGKTVVRKKFAIDLRTAEEMASDLQEQETDA